MCWWMFIAFVRPVYECYCRLARVSMQASIEIPSLKKSFPQEASRICTGPSHWLRKEFNCRRITYNVTGTFFVRDAYVQNFTSESAVCVRERWTFSRSAIGNGRKILHQKFSWGNRLERKATTVLRTTNGYRTIIATTLYRLIGCALIGWISSSKFCLSLGNESGVLIRSIWEQWNEAFFNEFQHLIRGQRN